MPRLILWDIDHTLIENSGVSKEIYSTAFEILTGRVPRRAARTNGRTDLAIMEGMLADNEVSGVEWSDMADALQRAGAAHREALAARGAVLPGVIALITALSGGRDVVQTVVTGNIRANAEVKLGSLGLGEHFDLAVGGYGSDHMERYRLVEIARQRTAEKYGLQYGEPDCAIVVGDTPRDIAAARRGGAEVLAVASGLYSADELRSAGGLLVVQDLADTDGLLRLLDVT